MHAYILTYTYRLTLVGFLPSLLHLRLAIINEDNLNSAMDMPCNEMEILGFISKQISESPACRLVPEEIIGKAVSQFGNKSFSEQDLKCFYNFALMVPPTLIRNLCQLHFSMVPAAKLRCPPKVFNSIAGIKDGGLHPYCKVECMYERTYVRMWDGGLGPRVWPIVQGPGHEPSHGVVLLHSMMRWP